MALLELLRKAELEEDVDFLREGVPAMAQQLMELEVAQQVGAEKYERTARRSGERNGYRERQWDTRVGNIELRVPRAGLSWPLPGRRGRGCARGAAVHADGRRASTWTTRARLARVAPPAQTRQARHAATAASRVQGSSSRRVELYAVLRALPSVASAPGRGHAPGIRRRRPEARSPRRLTSAAHFWPGSRVGLQGSRPRRLVTVAQLAVFGSCYEPLRCAGAALSCGLIPALQTEAPAVLRRARSARRAQSASGRCIGCFSPA
jgi:Transposase, Mutator family